MTRFFAALFVLLVTTLTAPAFAAPAAAKITLGKDKCGVYEGLAETIVGKATPGQLIYVQWGELNAPEDGVNYGEPQFMVNGKAAELEQFVDPGWYIFNQKKGNTFTMQYFNRGFVPEKFVVKVCVYNTLDANSMPASPLYRY